MTGAKKIAAAVKSDPAKSFSSDQRRVSRPVRRLVDGESDGQKLGHAGHPYARDGGKQLGLNYPGGGSIRYGPALVPAGRSLTLHLNGNAKCQ